MVRIHEWKNTEKNSTVKKTTKFKIYQQLSEKNQTRSKKKKSKYKQRLEKKNEKENIWQ